METKENIANTAAGPQIDQGWRRGKIAWGVVILATGALLLVREMGFTVPDWVLSWKLLLVVAGLIMGFKHNFQKAFWVVPFLVGSAFLFNDFYPELINPSLIWPVVLIVLGLLTLAKALGNKGPSGQEFRKDPNMSVRMKWKKEVNAGENPSDSHFEVVAFMGGVTKNVLSKDFRSGEVNAIMGGVELNMAQADIQSTATLEINAVFGGVKLIVPSHWEVVSEINCVLGGAEEKRGTAPLNSGSERKRLILEGNAVLGGIEIRSY